MTSRSGPPLRLALFAEQGHPDGVFRSGVTRLTDHLVAGCRKHGVVLDVFTYHAASGTDVRGRVRWHRVEPRLPVTFHGLRVDGLDILPRPNPRLRQAAGGRRYDVVLGTSPGIGTQGQLLAREQGVPFAAIYTTDLPHYAHSLLSALPGGGLAGRLVPRLGREAAWRYLRWLYHRARTERVLVPTEAARRSFVARVPARAEVLGRGSDTLRFTDGEVAEAHAAAACRAHQGQPVRLLYVGRIDYGQKNLLRLEEAVRSLPGTVLRVVGGGDDLPRLRDRLTPEIAEGRVEVSGRVDDPERLRRLYLASDLFLFPSLYDTLGQVVLEAQGAGLPVVVRDRGGPQELVRHGETGFVASDDTAFVARAARLVSDAEERRRMGWAAHRHADAMPGWTEVVEDLLGRLARLAGRGEGYLPPSVLTDARSAAARRM